MALNTAIAGLRRRNHNNIISFDPLTLPQDQPDENDARAREEQWTILQDAIQNLSNIEKAIVMLYLEERTYEEMEDIMGIGQNNLRVKMNRIKEKLKKITQRSQHGT